mgnify:CR=1 FL=1
MIENEKIEEMMMELEEKAEEPDEKPEEKKNREKRRDNRRKFVAACKLFHEIMNSEHPVPNKEQKKELRPLIDKLCHKLVVALDGVQNPGNLGTIIRLADWFGVEEIICSRECADCYNPKVVQATMGAILRVRIHYVDNLSKLLHEARDMGMNIYGTLLDGNNIYHEKLDNKGIIVMGNEESGISKEVLKLCTCKRHSYCGYECNKVKQIVDPRFIVGPIYATQQPDDGCRE